MTAEEPLARARRRLEEGASDAEVRLELLDQGLDAARIDEVMRTASPRRSVSWPWLLGGLGVCAVAAGAFVLFARSSFEGGTGSVISRGPLVIALIGAAFVARGLVPRG